MDMVHFNIIYSFGDTYYVWAACGDDMKGFVVICMNGNGTDLEQVIHTHVTSWVV